MHNSKLTYCTWPCQRQGHCVFLMYSKVWPSGSAAAQYISSQTCTHSQPAKDGKGKLKEVAVCVCPLQVVPSVPSPPSVNSLAFNSLCRASQPNHRPASFRLTEQGLWWEVTPLDMLFNHSWNEQANRLVSGKISAICVIYKVWVGEWQGSGSYCACVCMCMCVCVCMCVFRQLFIIIVITGVSLFSWTALTCDPREPLLWSQSERGSICGKTETETCSNHSPAHPVSGSILQLYKNDTIMKTYCAVAKKKEEEQQWWCKESRKCGGNGNAHKCKNGFCLFFSLSIKRRRLMQFHSQVWFTLAPIHCPRGWWRLRIFTLSNYQPLCPPTGLVNPFFHFLASHHMHQRNSHWFFGEHVAGEPSQTPLPSLLEPSGPEPKSPEKRSMSLWQIAAAHTEARGSV